MKYTRVNRPFDCMLTYSTCYNNTKEMAVKGILWHSTGANNPYIKRYVQPSDDASNRNEWLKHLGENKYHNDWNHINVEVGVNAFIGKLADGSVTTVQTMPWNYKPWGCASGKNGSCNNGWIQFEICEDNLDDKAYFEAVYQEACELTAYLCMIYNLDPHGTVKVNGIKVPVILCHADAHELGMGSNHGDVYNWFKKYGKTMDDVRNDVKKLLNPITPIVGAGVTNKRPYRVRKTWEDVKSQIGAFSNLENAKKACKEGYSVFDIEGNVIYTPTKSNESFLVKVTASGLNIRAEANADSTIKGVIRDKGVYTIVDTKDNWGKLKSGKGWINLKYTKKVNK